MPPKTTVFLFFTSLAFHVLAGAPFTPGFSDPSKNAEPVTIAYFRYETPPTPQGTTPLPEKPVVTAKEEKPIFQKTPRILKPDPVPLKPKAFLGEGPVRQSRELLNDPQKRQTFTNYFGLIKQKIHTTLQKKYLHHRVDEGVVTLAFVLKADGTLEKVTAVDQETRASETAKDFAVRCVEESAPFAAFPRTLGSNRIAFSVTVRFQEL